MRLFDLHSHWGTRRGYALRTDAERAQLGATWKTEERYDDEAGMAAYFRSSGARVILDFGFTKSLPIEDVRAYHDYAFETQRAAPDVIFGNWLQIDPRLSGGLAEFRRCLDRKAGFVGIAVSGSGHRVTAADPAWEPFYKLSIEAGAPVLIFVGYTGLGAGLPGGRGVVLDDCHPRHLDEVAARFPELRIIAARPAWPWQEEMIAILRHKANVWCELHGWSPKHLSDSLKRELPRRLSERTMFGADYPMFRYERLVEDWRAQGFGEDLLERIFYRNAEAFFGIGAS